MEGKVSYPEKLRSVPRTAVSLLFVCFPPMLLLLIFFFFFVLECVARFGG